MIKKNIIWIIILLLVISWSYIAFVLHKSGKKVALYQEVPPVVLTAIDNRNKILSDYDSDNSLLFIFFDTHCDFCQFELKELEKQVPEFVNTDIVLVSAEPLDTLRKFDKNHKFKNYLNCGIYHCPYGNLQKYFGKLVSPVALIYGVDRKLIKRFIGGTRIDEMLNVIRLNQNVISFPLENE